MTKKQRLTIFNVIMAVNAFTIAAISFMGLILKSDLTGRLIFGGTWTLVGTWWICKLFQNLRKN